MNDAWIVICTGICCFGGVVAIVAILTLALCRAAAKGDQQLGLE